MDTIICRSMQSFLDLCDNKLVDDVNIHCTFSLSLEEKQWMKHYFTQNGGCNLSTTDFNKLSSINFSQECLGAL